ncbi:hypothetical protein NKH77_34535 [Streptomyces sp. M19]
MAVTRAPTRRSPRRVAGTQGEHGRGKAAGPKSEWWSRPAARPDGPPSPGAPDTPAEPGTAPPANDSAEADRGGSRNGPATLPRGSRGRPGGAGVRARRRAAAGAGPTGLRGLLGLPRGRPEAPGGRPAISADAASSGDGVRSSGADTDKDAPEYLVAPRPRPSPADSSAADPVPAEPASADPVPTDPPRPRRRAVGPEPRPRPLHDPDPYGTRRTADQAVGARAARTAPGHHARAGHAPAAARRPRRPWPPRARHAGSALARDTSGAGHPPLVPQQARQPALAATVQWQSYDPWSAPHASPAATERGPSRGGAGWPWAPC